MNNLIIGVLMLLGGIVFLFVTIKYPEKDGDPNALNYRGILSGAVLIVIGCILIVKAI